VTLAFGLVSNAVLLWPGGLSTWRWLHLATAAVVTLMLVVMTGARFPRRKRTPRTGGGMFAVALLTGLIVLFTGWIGGEVLVFRSGMAVQAAGDGAFAPPVTSGGTPHDLHGAMYDIRAAWAAASVPTRTIIVHHPRPAWYEEAAAHARRLRELGHWLSQNGADASHAHGEHGEPQAHQEGEGHEERDTQGEKEGSGGERGGAEGSAQQKSALSSMGRQLERHAQAMEQAARAKQLVSLLAAASQVETTCASCHMATRWKH
jgi:hypothetical protein